MFNLHQIKAPPIIGLALAAGLTLAGCGQTPASVGSPLPKSTVQAGTVEAERSLKPWTIEAVAKAIRKQLEVNQPDRNVWLHELHVQAGPTILPYPAPKPTLYTFQAIEETVGLANYSRYFRIEGTFSTRTGKAVVESRIPAYGINKN